MKEIMDEYINKKDKYELKETGEKIDLNGHETLVSICKN